MIEHLVRIQFFVENGDHEAPILVGEYIEPLGRKKQFKIPELDASVKAQGWTKPDFFIVEVYEFVEV